MATSSTTAAYRVPRNRQVITHLVVLGKMLRKQCSSAPSWNSLPIQQDGKKPPPSLACSQNTKVLTMNFNWYPLKSVASNSRTRIMLPQPCVTTQNSALRKPHNTTSTTSSLDGIQTDRQHRSNHRFSRYRIAISSFGKTYQKHAAMPSARIAT